MELDEILAPLNVPFDFEERPIPLKAELRPRWRIGLLLMIVNHCWGGRANLKQLHVLNWALHTNEAQQNFFRIMDHAGLPDVAAVRFDPALNRAVDFSVGEGLLMVGSSGDLQLTDKATKVLEGIERMDVYSSAKLFFAKLKHKVSRAEVERFFASR